MPVHYRYDEFNRRLLTRCEGAVRLKDVVSHFRELTTIARLQPGSDVLLDLTFQTNVPSPEKIDSAAAILEEVTELLPLGRCAVIAPHGVPNDIGRRFQAVTWPLFSGMRLFASSGDAIEWLEQRSNPTASS
jgi:hypothetical protein